MTSTIAPEPIRAPASFAQQRLWFLQALEPTSAVYNVAEALRLRGPLQIPILERALNEVVRRHEALRTTFASVDGEPIQVIAPGEVRRLDVVDLSHLEPDSRELEAKRLTNQEAGRPFDLAGGPLLRTRLIRLEPEEHLLLVTMHHIISDGWSIGVFFEELRKVYAAFADGKPTHLPDLPIQYADYAAWQRDWLRGEVLDQQLGYWKRQMAGAPTVLNLPTDHPRPAILSPRGARQFFAIPDPLRDSLTRLAGWESVTLFMATLAAFATLLMRYTGQEDVVVATPIAGRRRPETESLIGFFTNTLLLRIDLSGDPSFRELLGRVREVTLDAHAHQDTPFDKLAEELRPERSLSHNPLFQVMFAFQNTPGITAILPGLEVERLEIVKGTSGSDLEVFLTETPSSLTGSVVYNTDLFDESTIHRLIGHFQVLLGAAAEDPGRRLWGLPILTEPERQQILVEWNATDVPQAEEGTVARLFEMQAQRTPDATAVRFETDSLSYRELDRRVNQLAQHLRRHGVHSNVLVGVFLERSVEMLVAVLGVMKAGGAYVPLDPAYPAARLEFMLEDAKISLVVTRAKLLDGISLPAAARALCLDRDARAIVGESEDSPPGSAGADDLAYVIYTSGSTGRPKGVQIAHRSLANVVTAFRTTLGVTTRDVLVSVTTLSFDIAGLELFLPLATGAQLVIASRQTAADPARLKALIAEAGATVMQATPGTWRILLESGWRAAPDLRILCGGEAFPPDLAARLVTAGAAAVWNVYGPTETTIWSTVHRVAEKTGPVPIGRPIANTQTYVLDANGEPVPVGVAGELHIGGVGVAHGYWNRPELTAERFIPDPFGADRDACIYKTGDLARYRADGEIEFLDRLDQQVKIRGYRVEPGEVEAALRRHPLVGDCAVVAQADPGGTRRLVAYVVAPDRQKLEPTSLRTFLKETLPDHMVPSLFRVVDSLPLTPNGKVDRKALACAEPERQAPKGGEQLPHTTPELVLVKIWERVLGVPVGVTDNFFELGGHSLMAAKLFGAIEKEFGRRLPLATLLQAPTVEALAERLRQQDWEPQWSSLVVIQGGRGRPPFFCVPGVGGNILGFHDLAKQLGPDQPVYGLQAQGLDGKSEPLTRVVDMAAHYIEEIRAMFPEGPFLIGGASFGGDVAFEMARQLKAAGQTPALVALFDTFAPGLSGSRPTLAATVKKYGSRVWFNGRNLLFGWGRRQYLRSKSRELRQRLRSRIWQMIYQSYRDRSKPLPRVLQNVREAGYLASRTNVGKPYSGRVTLFRAGSRSWRDPARPDLGWGRWAQGGVEIREVPGGHSDMFEPPHVEFLAVELRSCIDAALLIVDGSEQEPVSAR